MSKDAEMASPEAPASGPPVPDKSEDPLPLVTSDIAQYSTTRTAPSAPPPATSQPQAAAIRAKTSTPPTAQRGPTSQPPANGGVASALGPRSSSAQPLFGVMKPLRSVQPPSAAIYQGPAQSPQAYAAAATTSPPPASAAPAHVQRAPSAQWGRGGAAAGTVNRPVIVDPPRGNKDPAMIHASHFPSPELPHASLNPKFANDCTRLAHAIQQAEPGAVRRVMRDNWQRCLLGTEFHQAFILNATIHHTSPVLFQRAVRDFGTSMIRASAEAVIDVLTARELDIVCDAILNKASDRFLDQALARRLRTIEAKPLINALARAERLGYEPSDIVEDDHHQERVIPVPDNHGSAMAAQGTPQPSAARAEPPRSVPGQGPQLQCRTCSRTFEKLSAYEHHIKKKVCTRTPSTPQGFKFSCSHCGQGFTTIVGLQYHNANKVCGDFADVSHGLTANDPISLHSGSESPSSRAAQLPPASQPAPNIRFTAFNTPSTPASSQPARIVSTPTSGTPPGHHDPYAHLHPEQKAALEEELRQAEIAFADRMRVARTIPDPKERESRLSALSNSFGTKQSLIRKKYGVRLRQRRTRAEIEAERQRMAMSKGSRATSSPAAAALPQTPVTARVVSQPAQYASAGANGSAVGLARAAEEAMVGHDAKRQRVSEEGAKVATDNDAGNASSREARATVNMANGLLSASATASTQDPTMTPPSAQAPAPTRSAQASQPAAAYEQAGARIEIYEPARDAPASASSSSPGEHAVAVAARAPTSRASSLGRNGLSAEPISLDDDEVEDQESSDEEDIPAELPPSVRKSLPPAPPPPSSSGH